MMATTPNYNLPLPDPSGIQRAEIQRVADALTALDTALKALSLAKAPDATKLDGQPSDYYQQNVQAIGSIEIGATLSGDRVAFIDFHADDTNADYGGRVIRNAGVNGSLEISNNGTGGVAMTTPGPIGLTAAGGISLNGRPNFAGETPWDTGNFNPAMKLDTSAAYTRTMAAADISAAINNLMNGAPGALDTLNELAAALGNDPNFATTISGQIGGKFDKSGGVITGEVSISAGKLSVYGWGDNNSGVVQFGNSGTAYAYGVAGGNLNLNGFTSFAFAGNTVWHAGNFDPSTKLGVNAKAVNSAAADNATKWNGFTIAWRGQGGQPTWLMGLADDGNMDAFNPTNFSVNYANSAGYAGNTNFSLIGNMGAGGVGSYALLMQAPHSTVRNTGDLVAGSDLRYGSGLGGGGGAPGGTWRLMGYIGSAQTDAGNVSLFLRVA